jgi:hypothetical protein
VNSPVGPWTPGPINTVYCWSSSDRENRSTIAISNHSTAGFATSAVETFFDLADARSKLERWRQDYNQVRPHSALSDRSPRGIRARLETIERSLSAHGWAGKRKASPAVYRADAADPKLLQLFVPPSAEVKGGPEKLPMDSTEQAAKKGNLLEVVN